MTVRRIMGTETEYGIFAPHAPQADTEDLSRDLLAEYGAWCRELGFPDVRWDYSGEAAQARIGDPPSPVARLTEQEKCWYRGHSMVLRNGARLYVDHGHPEYATPETTTPRQATVHDLAGREVIARAVQRAAARDGQLAYTAFKNNVDGKGAAYGTHENYLLDRNVPAGDLVTALVPFLISRQVLCGAGRVGLGPAGETPGFQISQRADYIERVTGLETTVNRPIVNTRDEPHADGSRWRRLHVITSDANSLDQPILLKLGTLSLLLWVLENHGLPDAWAALTPADPVAACRHVSRDLTVPRRLPRPDGRELTAVQLQRAYLDEIRARLGPAPDPDTAGVLTLWEATLTQLENDPWTATGVEWVSKYLLLHQYRERGQLAWDDPRLAAADLQWSDVRPRRGLARRFGGLTIVGPDEIREAELTPPPDTRAWLRGTAPARLGEAVFAAGWQSLVLDAGGPHLLRLTIPDPGTATRDDVEAILADRTAGPAEVAERLGAYLVACRNG